MIEGSGIRAREVRGAVELPKSSGLKPGDHVKILGGPFRGHLALYAGMKPHQRVEVLLALFGQPAAGDLAARGC
jgi:transcription antitermination factor NusG